MKRRTFIAAGASVLASPAADESFAFVHFTDTHIQPELRAPEGCGQCFTKINALQPDFAISGGDLVFDANEVDKPRAKLQFDLYERALATLQIPVHGVIGNHDVLGMSNKSGVPASDPEYGKKMYEDRIGARYRSFDHKGWHFILLDSIGMTPDRGYIGLIDDAQLMWLKSDLEKTGRNRPIVAVTHIPLVTAFLSYGAGPDPATRSMVVTNSREVVRMLLEYQVKAVLQGHTHVREIVEYHGCQFITSGAVCGNWWKGLRMGHPEGFGLLRVTGGRISWQYHTYGFQASA
jgi:3',5'-cyclic AMP phosphodiesterase CpdA